MRRGGMVRREEARRREQEGEKRGAEGESDKREERVRGGGWEK